MSSTHNICALHCIVVIFYHLLRKSKLMSSSVWPGRHSGIKSFSAWSQFHPWAALYNTPGSGSGRARGKLSAVKSSFERRNITNLLRKYPGGKLYPLPQWNKDYLGAAGFLPVLKSANMKIEIRRGTKPYHHQKAPMSLNTSVCL